MDGYAFIILMYLITSCFVILAMIVGAVSAAVKREAERAELRTRAAWASDSK